MEFSFEPVCDQVRAGSSYLDMVADRFAAGLSQNSLRYPGRRQVRSWSRKGPKLVADLLARASSVL